MGKATITFLLLVFLVDWSAADTGSSFGATRDFETLEEFTQELNRERKIDQTGGPTPLRNTDPTRITSGRRLYRNHCLRCHGENAQGAPNWHHRDTQGNFPPPPLDGSAHTWHHPRAQLVEMIQKGGEIMPPFRTVLNANEIDDIIHWFQSLWPDDLYQVWARQNETYENSSN